VLAAQGFLLVAALGDAGAGAGQLDVEVHTVNTGGGVVLQAQVDVFGDTEPEAAVLGEVAVTQLEVLHLQALLDDLLGLLAADGHVARDLLVTTNVEVTVGEAGLGEARLLLGQLLQNLGGTSEPVTRFTDTDVQGELFDADLTHRIIGRVSHLDEFPASETLCDQ